ncbi:MAG: hypothetical protein DRP78_05705, partial [Candidatus Omnitrophota bacterium]
EKYDLAVCLDKSPQAAALIMLVQAKEKAGYGMNAYGNVFALNKSAEYCLNLGINNVLKFKKNKKTYQELIFSIIGQKYKQEEYVLNLSKEQLVFSKKIVKEYSLEKKDIIVGINSGASAAFSTKKWLESNIIDLAEKLAGLKNTKIFLLGGENERAQNQRISEKVSFVINTGSYSFQEFIALVNCCDIVVSGDTLAMHIAIALKKRVVAIFGPTCAQEIEIFSRGEKIAANVPCAPCYKLDCADKYCMQAITPEIVLASVKRQIRVVRKLKLK